jgi:DNA adenine methylase
VPFLPPHIPLCQTPPAVNCPHRAEDLKDKNLETLTDIQRAVRFYFILKNSFSGRIKKPSFNISPYRLSGFNLLRIAEELSAIHLRLARV